MSDTIALTKYCKYCDSILPLDNFTKRSASIDGLSYKCRKCSAAYSKNRYHQVDGIAESYKYRAKQWSNKNKEKRKQICQKYTEKNYFSERERKRIYQISFRKNNPEKARFNGVIAAQKRRCRIIKNNSFILAEFASRLLKKANGTCTYCMKKNQKLTIDHFVPVSQGGGGQAWNLIPCCKSCNSSKGIKDGPSWIESKFGIDRIGYVLHRIERDLYSARLP